MRFSAKTSAAERIYAIGDIHGRLDLFDRLLETIDRDHGRRMPVPTKLILLGDLIDRGPQSAQVVRTCMRITARTDNFIVLKGNHEAMAVDALGGDYAALEMWLEHGGRETLASWGVSSAFFDEGATVNLLSAARQAIPQEVIDWWRALPLSYRSDEYLFVHAGVRPGIKLSRLSGEDCLWIREPFLSSDADHGAIVVHGHTVHEGGPVIRLNRIGIDTGAWRTGRLTAVGLEGADQWTLMTDVDVGNRRSPEWRPEDALRAAG